jgi:hypothetical protein
MQSLGFRYASLLAGILALFAGFVACGTQLYNVSLKDDTDPAKSPAGSTDPSAYTYGLHAPGGWHKLPIHFKVGVALTPEQHKGLTKAMTTWESAVGIKLFVFDGVHSGTTGDTFKDLYSSLDDRVNGHYLDEHWDKTGKPTVVLATTIWDNDPDDVAKILTADIRFNSDYYMLGDSFALEATDDREVVDMQTLALHELGHLIGLAHIAPAVDSGSIMTASLYIGEGLANRRLSRGDVTRVQKIYGCLGDSCDVEKTLARLDKLELSERKADVETDTAH